MTTLADPGRPPEHDRTSAWRRGLHLIQQPPVLLALAAMPVLVWLSRGMTFYHDEYTFILVRDLSLRGIFAPHNEHLSALPVIVYRVLLGTVGMASYWPYLAVLFALHIAVAGIVYVVVRREASMPWALGAMAVMLMLGSGGDDVLWAFQMGTIGAVAGGMAAVVVAPRRPGLAALFLTLALGCSGVALAFVVATALHLLLTRPAALVWLVIPVGLYLVWYVTFGSSGLGGVGLAGLPQYVLSGLDASAAGALGTTSPVVGGLVLVTVAIAVVLGVGWARPVPPAVLALLAAALAFFAIAGLVRAQLGPEQATAPRYVYVAAPAFLVAGAVLLARIRRPLGYVVGIAVLAVALTGNVLLLVESHDRLLSKVECERSMTPLARGSAGNPC
jgi:hypothetical protein